MHDRVHDDHVYDRVHDDYVHDRVHDRLHDHVHVEQHSYIIGMILCRGMIYCTRCYMSVLSSYL